MKVSRALQRTWDAKLRKAGFQDLEGTDRDGPLSDRGNLHAVNEDPEAIAHLGDRMTHGAAYTRWADSVLHTHAFVSRRQREVWRRHAEGESLREIGAAMRISYHAARDQVLAVRAAVSDQPDRGNGGNESCREIRRMIRRSDPGLLARLALVLLQGQRDRG